MFYDAAVDLTQRSAAVCESALVFGEFMDDYDVMVGCESIGLEADAAGGKQKWYVRLKNFLSRIMHAIATFFKRLISTQVYAGAADVVTREYAKLIDSAEFLEGFVKDLDRDDPRAAFETWKKRQSMDKEGLTEKINAANAAADAELQKIKSAPGGTATHGIRSMKDYKASIQKLHNISNAMYKQVEKLISATANGLTERNLQNMSDCYSEAASIVNRIATSYMGALQKCIYTTKRQNNATYKKDRKNHHAAGDNKADIYQKTKMEKYVN